MGTLAARRGGEGGREGEMGEEREGGGERESEEERRGWETGCLQLSCGSAAAEPPASAGPTRTYVEREQIDGCKAHSTRFHVSSPLSAVVFRVGAGDPTAG
jgi:hypothetical protein